MNGTVVKNQLIFDFASGSLGPSKSIFTSTYLYLNSKASSLNRTFEGMLGNNLIQNSDSKLESIKYSDCISDSKSASKKIISNNNPISKLVGSFENIKWKQVYKGFSEYVPDIKDEDELKLIKMDPGASVPLHSHGGKEYILVLDGSFCDEYGNYSIGDIQVNDQKVKHTPIASKDTGCICLSITEKDVIFFGRFASFLNLFTFIKSFFK